MAQLIAGESIPCFEIGRILIQAEEIIRLLPHVFVGRNHEPKDATGRVNEFKIAGLDALRSHKKGRKKTLSQSKTPKIENQVHQPMVDVSVEHVQELEDENLKLRIENAFLKETRRLRLEDEAKMRELRKSSPVSQEHSN